MINLIAQLQETELSPDNLPISGLSDFLRTNGNNAPDRLENFLSILIGFITVVAGLAFLLYMLFGGLQWITSQGDPQKVESARNQMTAAGMGLVVIVAAYAIAGIVGMVLGIDILNPAAVFETITN